MRKHDAERLLARALRDEGVSPDMQAATKLAADLFDRMPEIEWDPRIPKHAQELKELGAKIERDRLRPLVDEALETGTDEAKAKLKKEVDPDG